MKFDSKMEIKQHAKILKSTINPLTGYKIRCYEVYINRDIIPFDPKFAIHGEDKVTKQYITGAKCNITYELYRS
jgi:hypothetical protein